MVPLMRAGALYRNGERIVARAWLADGWWSRLRGTLFRRPLAADASEAMLIEPCAAVHTCGLGYRLDIVFLDAAGTALDLRRGVRPWRACRRRGAYSVLEFHEGAIDRLRIARGDLIEWQRAH